MVCLVRLYFIQGFLFITVIVLAPFLMAGTKPIPSGPVNPPEQGWRLPSGAASRQTQALTALMGGSPGLAARPAQAGASSEPGEEVGLGLDLGLTKVRINPTWGKRRERSQRQLAVAVCGSSSPLRLFLLGEMALCFCQVTLLSSLAEKSFLLCHGLCWFLA